METGACELILAGHASPALCVAVLSDGRVLSGSLERVVRVWDLTSLDSGGAGGVARLAPMLLRGHADAVRAVGQLADGRLFSASDDGTLRLWGAGDGRPDAVLRAPGAKAVLSAAQLPDGQLLTGSADGTLRLWALPPPCRAGAAAATHSAPARVLCGHSGPVNALAVPAAARDGARAVSGAADGDVRVWNVDTGACMRTLSGHKGSVTGVGVLPGGLLVSASMDRTVRVWDADVGSCERVLTGHRHWINALLVLPEGRVVTASSDRTLRFWRSGECHLILPREKPRTHAFPDGSSAGTPDEVEDVVYDAVAVAAAALAAAEAAAAAAEEDAALGCREIAQLEPETGEFALSPVGSDWVEEVARWDLRAASMGADGAGAGDDDVGLRPWCGLSGADDEERGPAWLPRSPAAAGGAAAIGAVALLGVVTLLRSASGGGRSPAPAAQPALNERDAAREERRRRRAAAAAAAAAAEKR
jgi:hypothetical protein